MKRSPGRSIGIYIIILLVVFMLMSSATSRNYNTSGYTFDQFKNAIQNEQVTRDTYKLTRHVAVILAVKESIETNQEVRIGK